MKVNPSGKANRNGVTEGRYGRAKHRSLTQIFVGVFETQTLVDRPLLAGID